MTSWGEHWDIDLVQDSFSIKRPDGTKPRLSRGAYQRPWSEGKSQLDFYGYFGRYAVSKTRIGGLTCKQSGYFIYILLFTRGTGITSC